MRVASGGIRTHDTLYSMYIHTNTNIHSHTHECTNIHCVHTFTHTNIFTHIVDYCLCGKTRFCRPCWGSWSHWLVPLPIHTCTYLYCLLRYLTPSPLSCLLSHSLPSFLSLSLPSSLPHCLSPSLPPLLLVSLPHFLLSSLSLSLTSSLPPLLPFSLPHFFPSSSLPCLSPSLPPFLIVSLSHFSSPPCLPLPHFLPSSLHSFSLSLTPFPSPFSVCLSLSLPLPLPLSLFSLSLSLSLSLSDGVLLIDPEYFKKESKKDRKGLLLIVINEVTVTEWGGEDEGRMEFSLPLEMFACTMYVIKGYPLKVFKAIQ